MLKNFLLTIKKFISVQSDKKSDSYNSQGLVEALLALFLASVAGVVFLSLAQDTYLNMDRIEITERLVREIDGVSAKITRLADLENSKESGDPSYFPFKTGRADWNGCYRIDGGIENPSLTYICSLGDLTRTGNNCRNTAVGEDLTDGDFAAFCLNNYDQESGIVTGVIYAGRIDCRKVAFTGSCLIKDQQKYLLFKLN